MISTFRSVVDNFPPESDIKKLKKLKMNEDSN